MGIYSLKYKTLSPIRCDLCKKPVKEFYQIAIDGNSYKFCSGLHAEMARKNFEANKKLKITQQEEKHDEGTGETNEDF